MWSRVGACGYKARHRVDGSIERRAALVSHGRPCVVTGRGARGYRAGCAWLQGGVRMVQGGVRVPAWRAGTHGAARTHARARPRTAAARRSGWALPTAGCSPAVVVAPGAVWCGVWCAEGTPGPGTRAARVTYVRRRASCPAPQARGKQAGTRAPQAHAAWVAARRCCQRRCARNRSLWDAMRPDRRVAVGRRGRVGGTTAAARALRRSRDE